MCDAFVDKRRPSQDFPKATRQAETKPQTPRTHRIITLPTGAQTATLPQNVGHIRLSVLIRTYNEADRLGRTLDSVGALGAEVVIIDAGSTDETVKIAEGYGARVVHNPWPGFGPQRHFGEDRCGNDHVFSLDADEVLTPKLVAEIRAVFARADVPSLMTVRKAIVFPNHDKPTVWAFCHKQVLIYDRRIARTAPNPNWDALELSTSDKPHLIKAPLWHYTFRDWRHAVAKANYVARLAADTQKIRSRAYLRTRLVIEFPLTFFKFYLARRYFLGGTDGLTMAMVGAFGRYIRIAMMLERVKRDARKRV